MHEYFKCGCINGYIGREIFIGNLLSKQHLSQFGSPVTIPGDVDLDLIAGTFHSVKQFRSGRNGGLFYGGNNNSIVIAG